MTQMCVFHWGLWHRLGVGTDVHLADFANQL